MKKAFFFALFGFFLGLGAPLGALSLLWFSPHPALQLPYFIAEEWKDHLFFFTYMLSGTSLSFAFFGFMLGRSMDVIQAQNKKLSHQATQDDLTGLGNHRFLHEIFKVEFQKHMTDHKPLSCLMMDLDHFKKVNDTCGHPFGDFVLKHFSMILKKSVRSRDVATRYGGEEFLCILPDCDLKEAHQVAERIRKETEQYTFSDGQNQMPVTVSIGAVTSYGRSGTSYQHLIALADQALYEAKHKGRNRIVQEALTLTKRNSRRK